MPVDQSIILSLHVLHNVYNQNTNFTRYNNAIAEQQTGLIRFPQWPMNVSLNKSVSSSVCIEHLCKHYSVHFHLVPSLVFTSLRSNDDFGKTVYEQH